MAGSKLLPLGETRPDAASKRSVPARLLVTFLAATTLAAGRPAAAQPAISIEFDCAVSHPFAGFGLNVVPLDGRLQGLVRLIRQLRVNFIRWGPLPDVEEADIPNGASFEELVDWMERTTAERQARNLRFFERMQSLGINQLAVAWRPPVKWRVGRTRVLNGKLNRQIAEEYVDAYGALVAAGLTTLKRHGMAPYAVELINEPVLKIHGNQYAQLVSTFLALRRREGLSAIRLAGPGTVYTTENRGYMQAVVKRGGKLDIVSTHAYDNNQERRLASLRRLMPDIPANWDVPIFVTEYGIDPIVWYQDAAAIRSEPYAVMVAAQALALFGSGASTTFIWQAQRPPWAKEGAWELLDDQDQPLPAVHSLATILTPLKVDDRIVSPKTSDEALPIALFAGSAQLVLNVANPTTELRTYNISFANCTTTPITITRTQSWPTNRSAEVQSTSAAGLRVSLPANTITSLTLSRQP